MMMIFTTLLNTIKIEQIIEAESPVHINTIGERFRIAYGIKLEDT